LVSTPGARHHFASKPQENGGIWHLLTHEPRQEFVRVDHGQLTPRLRLLDIHTLRFKTRTERFPVSGCWDQNHAFSVGQGSSGEAADGPVKKLLVLIKLNNMFGWRSIVQEISPRFVILRFVATSAARRLKAGHGILRWLRAGLKRTHGRFLRGKILSAFMVWKGLESLMRLPTAELLLQR
jgi:hypothetical protein